LHTATQHRSAKEKDKGKNRCRVLLSLGVALVMLGFFCSSLLLHSSAAFCLSFTGRVVFSLPLFEAIERWRETRRKVYREVMSMIRIRLIE
jgi:uncharacterized membrane protein YiaA